MNNETNNISFRKSISFIFSFVKKYIYAVIIIAVLILATTYFQVISPKLMGNSIDEMTKYVSQAKIQNVYDNIAQGKGISEKDKKLLLNNNSMSEENKNKIESATAEQLKEMYDKKKFIESVFNKDNQYIIEGRGFNPTQQKMIYESDYLTKEEKGAMLLVPNNVVIVQYLKTIDGLTDDEKNKLDKLTVEQLSNLYSVATVRLEAIKLDETVLEDGKWTEEQITYIKSQNITDEVQVEILNSSKAEINQAYKNQSLKVDVNKQYRQFLKSLVILIITYIGLFFTMLFYNRLMATIGGNTTRDIRKGMFGKIGNLSIRFFDKANAGDLLSRFTNDIDNISNALTQVLVQVLSQGAMIIGIVYIMFKEDTTTATLNVFNIEVTINNVLVWSMFVFALIAIIIAFFFIKKARYHVSRQQSKLGALNGYIDERISGQKVVISYGLEEETLKQFDEFNHELKSTSIKGQVYSGILMPIMQGIGFVNLGFLVFLGSNYVIDGVMSIGLLAAFIQYSQRFFNPLAQVVSQYNMLELAAAGAGRAKEIFDEEPEVVNLPGAKPITGISGDVVLDNVSFGYDPNKLVLENINLEVKKGQMIALVGPTGSGKTTVMNLMNRFYDVTSGEIRFDGEPIKNITLDSLRSNVGIVLQESIMFSGTIRDNIAYGKFDATDEEVINAAKLANIHEFIMTLEEGYDTHVDNSTSMFSTGQKQLISIARTVLTNPDLLILDEATSNVDTVTEAKIQKAMDNIVHDRTSFVIAHRLKTILNADKIIVLQDGKIIESGNHEQLLEQKGFYSELYYNQFVLE